jgi:SAM-dependent methyltransferase
MPEDSYRGTELELFALAGNWKRYLFDLVNPYLRGDLLEVGGGIGSNARCFLERGAAVSSWALLEPDPRLCARARAQDLRLKDGYSIHVLQGTTETLGQEARYDSILYLDVLEHIEHDRRELDRAGKLLRAGGFLVVMSPAHSALFSPFDEAIGHFRRYNRKGLLALSPPGCKVEFVGYIDSAGCLASLANRFFLRQKAPQERQIRFWDSVLIRLSRIFDPVFGYMVGKSILVVWRAP